MVKVESEYGVVKLEGKGSLRMKMIDAICIVNALYKQIGSDSKEVQALFLEEIKKLDKNGMEIKTVEIENGKSKEMQEIVDEIKKIRKAVIGNDND